MKKLSIFILLFPVFLFSRCGDNPDIEKPRTIMIILDGLASGGIQKVPLVNLQYWIKAGCFYKEVYLPLPAYPDKSTGYIWNCSIPNPVMMTGTVFIGQDSIKNFMVQHMFQDKKTAFIVNDDSYGDISRDFDFYYNLKTKESDLYNDKLVLDKAREVIKNDNPEFLRLHLQGPGAAGNECSLPKNKDEKWYQNIWHENSPYIQQLKKDDELIEEFINWLHYEGYWENSTLFILGDHGQANAGGYSAYDPESCKTELLILGKNVKPGALFNYAEITDIAPTIIRINNLPSLRFSAGRILEEAFKWGPESFSPERKIENLDNLLMNHQRSVNPSNSISNGFMTINNICNWHTVIAPVSLDEFIRYEEKTIK